MRLEGILGGLILCELILGIATIVTGSVSDGWILFAFWVSIVVSTVLAWIGLLSLLRPARAIYLASWCAYLLYVVLTGPTVVSPFVAVLDDAMAMVGGAILGLVYFSELRLRFRTLSEAWR